MRFPIAVIGYIYHGTAKKLYSSKWLLNIAKSDTIKIISYDVAKQRLLNQCLIFSKFYVLLLWLTSSIFVALFLTNRLIEFSNECEECRSGFKQWYSLVY